MSGDSSIFGRLLADWDHVEHGVSEDFRWFGEAAENLVHGHPYPDDPPSLAAQITAARASQAPAVMPVNVEAAPAAQPEENIMPLLDELKAHVTEDLAAVEAKLKGVDEEALGVLNAVMANPETAGVLKDLGGLAAIVGIPEGTISGVATGLKTILSLYAQPAAPEAPAAPAEPAAA